MEKINKLLRQLPEKPLRWLLQVAMIDGIPTRVKEETALNNSRTTAIDFSTLEFDGTFLSVMGVDGETIIYIYNGETNTEIVKWRDPTQQEIKAIYRGMEKFKNMYYVDANKYDSRALHLGYLNQEKQSDGRVFCGGNVLFEKGKGFALPVSWKEKDTNIFLQAGFTLNDMFGCYEYNDLPFYIYEEGRYLTLKTDIHMEECLSTGTIPATLENLQNLIKAFNPPPTK